MGRRKGFTLLEIILAVMIMAVGIISIMRFGPTILQVRSNIDKDTESIFLAIKKMEELRGRILYDFDKPGGYSEGEAAFLPPHSDYRYIVRDNMNPLIKTIEVNIWHMNSAGKRIILYTKIAKR